MGDSDQQKTRLIILGVAGLLLLACAAGWLWYSKEKEEKAHLEHMAEGVPTVPDKSGAPVATATNSPVTPGKSVVPPVAVTTNSPATPGKSVVPPVAVTANSPVVPGKSAVPPVAVTTNSPVVPGKSAVPPVAVTANSPMVLGKSVVPPVAVTANSPVTPGKSAVPPVAATTNPPLTIMPGASPTVPVADQVQTDGSSAAKFLATKRQDALPKAKQMSGRQDPMLPFADANPWPRWGKEREVVADAGLAPPSTTEADKSRSKAKLVKDKIASAARQKLVPPPPPTGPGLGGGYGGVDKALPISDLPLPPEKPSIAGSLKLSAVVGNRAIIDVPVELRFKNKWPSTLSLGPGEQFESIRVVSVDPDSVTLDEDGERCVKTMASVR